MCTKTSLKKEKREKAMKALFAAMDKGYNLGTKGKAFSRDQFYDFRFYYVNNKDFFSWDDDTNGFKK